MTATEKALHHIKQLTQENLKEVIAGAITFIKKPEKGIGTELFNALFHIVPQVCVELIVVDNINAPSRILTIYRSNADKNFPDRRHCPGTYIRFEELDIDALMRCVKTELGQNIVKFEFATHYNNPVSCAGDENVGGNKHHTIGLVYLVQIAGDPTTNVKAEWTDHIPLNLLQGHKNFVSEVLGWPIS